MPVTTKELSTTTDQATQNTAIAGKEAAGTAASAVSTHETNKHPASSNGASVYLNNATEPAAADIPVNNRIVYPKSDNSLIVKDASGNIYTFGKGYIKTHTSQLIAAALTYVQVPITSNDMMIEGTFKLPVGDNPALGLRTVAMTIGAGSTPQTGYLYRFEGLLGDTTKNGLTSTISTLMQLGASADALENENVYIKLRIRNAANTGRKTHISLIDCYFRGLANFYLSTFGSGTVTTAQADDFIRFRGQTANGNLVGEFDTWDL